MQMWLKSEAIIEATKTLKIAWVLSGREAFIFVEAADDLRQMKQEIGPLIVPERSKERPLIHILTAW